MIWFIFSLGNGGISPVQQQIHKMLGEIFGGMNYAKVAVSTPYFYTVGVWNTVAVRLIRLCRFGCEFQCRRWSSCDVLRSVVFSASHCYRYNGVYLSPMWILTDFECVMDKHMRPVPYTEQNQLQITEEEKVQWGLDSAWKETSEIPPGAQR